MKGSNTLHLCPAEMHAAMEYYLNHVVFTVEHEVKVCTVKEKTGMESGFDVSLKEPSDES